MLAVPQMMKVYLHRFLIARISLLHFTTLSQHLHRMEGRLYTKAALFQNFVCISYFPTPTITCLAEIKKLEVNGYKIEKPTSHLYALHLTLSSSITNFRNEAGKYTNVGLFDDDFPVAKGHLQ